MRLLAACAALLGGLAWATHVQFGVMEIHRADEAINVPWALPAATIHDWPGEFGWDGTGGCPRDRMSRENYSAGRIAWRTALSGPEFGGPCVRGKLAIVPILDPASRTMSLAAYRVDDGELAWKSALAADLELHSGASKHWATPACDGQFVYLAASTGGRLRVYAVGLNGKLAWDRDAGPMACEDGRLVSPLLFESLVIVSAEHRGAPLHAWRSSSHLTALHRLTGEIIYRVRQPNGDGATMPTLAKIGAQTQMVVQNPKRITAFDPRRGEPIWWFRHNAERRANSIAWDSERIYAGMAGSDPQLLAIRADGKGDVTDTHLAWRAAAMGSTVIAPVRGRDMVLSLQTDGGLAALDATSGKLLWRKSLTGTFVRPPIPIGNDLLCLSTQGQAYVVDLAQKAELFEWRLPAGVVAPIAATAEKFIARDRDGLTCFLLGERQMPPAVTAPQRPLNRL